jgi:hypothetical protein
MRRTCHRLAILALIGLGVGPAGCGNRFVPEVRLPETGATLEGTVTYGGQKVMVALVVAQGPNGSATGFIDDDGRYRLQNVPLGEVSLAVNTDAGKGQLTGKLMARAQSKSKAPVPRVIDLPRKYFDPATSGIKTTVNKGENTFDIVIPK